MTPISHVGCGTAVVGALSPLFHKYFTISYKAIFFISLTGAIAPDIDALSLTFSQKIYYGMHWYSHHIFAHSLAGAGLLSLIIALLYLLTAVSGRGIRNLFRGDKVYLEHKIKKLIGAFIISYIACVTHFWGDLIAPPGPWKGIAMYWPSMNMAGGWGWINWFNWYIIYISVLVIIGLAASYLFSGIMLMIPYIKKSKLQIVFYAVPVVISLVFIFSSVSFVSKNDFSKMGYNRWEKMNRDKVPAKYKKLMDEGLKWGSKLFSMKPITLDTLNKAWNSIKEKLHKQYLPAKNIITPLMPADISPGEAMRLYRSLQKITPGMEDQHYGDYRFWILRDSLPNPNYYERSFLAYLVHKYNKNVFQMSNAYMIVFKILERDKEKKALRVQLVFHSNKIYVPGAAVPQINLHLVKDSIYYHHFFDKHDRKPYNIIPGIGYSRYGNRTGGFFPSMNFRTGWIWPGIKTGVYVHSGHWSEGCIIATYTHFDAATHFKYQYEELWKLMDEVIDITKDGVPLRPGKNRIVGKMIFIKDPSVKDTAAAEKPKKS